MSARAWLYLVLFLAVLGLAGVGYLFWIQNGAQEVTVSLELWGLGRLGRVWKAPELIAVSGAVGFVLGVVPFLIAWWRASSEAKRLRQQVALSGSDSASTWR